MATNSVILIGQEPDHENLPLRLTSGRRSVYKVPLKRTGSSLEIIPPNEDWNKPSSNNSIDPPTSPSGSHASLPHTCSLENSRQSQSAGSTERSCTKAGAINNLMASDKRRNSAEANIERCDSPKKQVFLPSVRRNFEQNGMPKDATLDIILRENMSSPIEQAAYRSNHDNSDHSNKASKQSIDAMLQNVSIRVDGNKMEHKQRKGSGKKSHRSVQKSASIETDAYYLSHGVEHQSTESPKSLTSTNTPAPCTTDSYYVSHGTGDDPDSVNTSLEHQAKPKEDPASSGEENDSDEAPFELLGEFLEAVMDEEWEDSEKLCKMVLLYEPDNPEAKQFQPLIEEMLRREREKQLLGSDSEDDCSDEEDSSEEDSSDENSSDEDDEESEEESSTSESESENETLQDCGGRKVEKKERELKMMNAIKDSTSADPTR